ncbi:MAG: hypothetical protein QOE23_2189 [Pseudonocardiales bacterium]|nr:hypothetical protein [Pseudonocardiales bacterium]
MPGTIAPSIIRTLAGYLVAWLLSIGLANPILDLLGLDRASETTQQRLVGTAVFVIGTVYYLVVRLLEKRWPKMTVLLGSHKQPVSYAVSPRG